MFVDAITQREPALIQVRDSRNISEGRILDAAVFETHRWWLSRVLLVS